MVKYKMKKNEKGHLTIKMERGEEYHIFEMVDCRLDFSVIIQFIESENKKLNQINDEISGGYDLEEERIPLFERG